MKKEFKTESKKILNMMINSIYTNEEIFLRELISNASDALDKLYYKSLTDKSLDIKRDDLKIKVSFDKDKRTITIADNGIGMTQEELENNLGTIARSGSELFKLENEHKENIFLEKIFQNILKYFRAIIILSMIVSLFIEVIEGRWSKQDYDLEQARNIEIELVPHFETDLSYEDIIRDKGFRLYYDIYFINNIDKGNDYR